MHQNRCRVLTCFALLSAFAALEPPAASAQSAVYHLHNEASATSGFKQLKSAGPDAAQASIQTAALQGVATGEKKIVELDTIAGVPNTAGKIPSGATVSAVVWMRKTAALGTMFPRIKLRLNSATGTAFCTATGTTALTTTLTAYPISCTTTATITMVAADRLYLWAGVNLTAGSSSGAFRGEMGIEGTLNGSANSRVDVPTALPAPTIATLTPNVGPVGTTVTVAGNNFRNQQLGGSVKFFNNRTATITSWSNTSIVVNVPASSVTGSVTVTVAGTVSGGVPFSVGNVPTISVLNPSAGLPGTAVVITGTNFGATKGSSTVKFNGITASTSTWSATSITASVPAGATTGNVVVTVGGIPSSGTTFTVPVLTSVTVSPSGLPLPVNSLQRFKARAHYSDGSSQIVTSGITWVSTDPSVATVGATGVGQTLTQGETSIDATVGGLTGSAAVQVVGPSFVPVGSMAEQRLAHSATLLNDGRVLVAGGTNTWPLASAELYTPATRAFTTTGSMALLRYSHSATRLANGKVLVAGGLTPMFGDYMLPTPTAEIYDPATGLFSATGTLTVARSGHSATLLPDGKVLIVGGDVDGGVVGAIEIYDPVAGTFSDTGLIEERSGHTTSNLSDGTLLVIGGVDGGLFEPPLQTTLIYEPTTGTLTPSGSLVTGSRDHTATILLDGTVLVAGGSFGAQSGIIGRAERVSTQTGTSTPTDSLITVRARHSANLLADGSVLVVGGSIESGGAVSTAERFDAPSDTFVGAGSPNSARHIHTATTLSDGTVLVAGGLGAGASAELYGPPLPPPASLSIAPNPVTLRLGATQQFVAVDNLGNQRYDAIWSVSDAELATIGTYSSPTLTALDYGQVTVTATIGAVSAQAQVAIAPLSLQVTPTEVTMLDGETRQFSVVDEKGKPTSRATWTVDQPSLASISADPRPWLTATGTGTVQLTASIQGVSGTAAVTIAPGTALPVGTRRWTVPSPPGATSTQMVQAGGSGDGPGSYAIAQNGSQSSIKALTNDGQQLWEVVGLPIASAVPDAFGGLLVTVHADCDGVNPMTLLNFDRFGNQQWHYTGASTCPAGPPKMAIRRDGVIAVATPGNLSGFPPLMLIDGATSTVVSIPTIPASSFQSVNGQWTPGYSRIGPPIVDVDGAVYVQYEQRTVSYPPTVVSTSLKLLKIPVTGSSTTTTLLTLTTNVNLFPGRIIPDGQNGVIATYVVQPATGPPDPSPFRAARVSSGVTNYTLPIASPVIDDAYSVPLSPEMVLGQGNLVFASYGTTLTAFDISSGAMAWNHAAANAVTIVAADDVGGVVAKTPGANGNDTILRFASGGTSSSTSFGIGNVDHVVKRLWATSTATAGSSAVEGEDVDWATTGWPQPSPGGQSRPKGIYRDRLGVPGHQDAAFAIMQDLRYAVELTLHEWGGLVCKVGSDYRWGSRLVEGDAGSVNVQAGSGCPGATLWADVHLHVMASGFGEANPSGDDLAGANGQPSVIRYLSTKSQLSTVPSPMFFRYKGGVAPNDAYASICFRAFGEWRKWSDSSQTCGPL